MKPSREKTRASQPSMHRKCASINPARATQRNLMSKGPASTHTPTRQDTSPECLPCQSKCRAIQCNAYHANAKVVGKPNENQDEKHRTFPLPSNAPCMQSNTHPPIMMPRRYRLMPSRRLPNRASNPSDTEVQPGAKKEKRKENRKKEKTANEQSRRRVAATRRL
jgi:hypothetical protein